MTKNEDLLPTLLDVVQKLAAEDDKPWRWDDYGHCPLCGSRRSHGAKRDQPARMGEGAGERIEHEDACPIALSHRVLEHVKAELPGLLLKIESVMLGPEEEAFGGAGSTLMRKRRDAQSDPTHAQVALGDGEEQLRHALTAARAERDEAQQRCGEARAEVEPLYDAVCQLRGLLAAVEQERDEAKEQRDDARARLATFPPPEALARLVANVDRLVAELDDEQGPLAEVTDRMEMAEAELAVTRGLVKDLQTQRDSLRATLDEATPLERSLAKQIEEACASRDLFRNALHALRVKVGDEACGMIIGPGLTAPHDADEARADDAARVEGGEPTIASTLRTLREEEEKDALLRGMIVAGFPVKVDPKLPPDEINLDEVRITNIGPEPEPEPAHDDDDGEAE